MIKIVKKGTPYQELKDRCGHVFSSENYFEEFYLEKAKSKMLIKKKFTFPSHEVFITPDKMFEPLIEVSIYWTEDDLPIGNEVYLKLWKRM